MWEPISVKEMDVFGSHLDDWIKCHSLSGHLKNTDSGYIESGRVIYNIGKYGYGVSDNSQYDDFEILRDAVCELEPVIPEGCKVRVEFSDKYNQVNLERG